VTGSDDARSDAVDSGTPPADAVFATVRLPIVGYEDSNGKRVPGWGDIQAAVDTAQEQADQSNDPIMKQLWSNAHDEISNQLLAQEGP